MPNFMINRTQINAAVLPPILADFISIYQWQAICIGLNEVETQAHTWVFLCEFLICIVFLFPCIFLCHPCVYLLMESSMKGSVVNKLNRSLFNGSPVLRWTDHCLTVNTDIIPAGLGPVASVVVVQSAYSPMAHATVIDPYSNPNVVVVTTSQPQTAVASSGGDVESQQQGAVAAASRSMAFNLPADITPGQVLNIAAPDGQMIKFIVEAHHQPGQQVILTY